MRSCLIFLAVLFGSGPALAQQAEAARAVRDAAVAGAAVAHVPPAPEEPFARFVERQASLELQIGLRLYAAADDYRAITALRRYQLLLPASGHAQLLGALMIGQIYRRNGKPELAAFAFEEAARAAERPYERTFAYLLGLQELCLPLSLYVQCRERLGALLDGPLEAEARQLVEFQLLYTDVVLRQPVDAERAERFERAPLREKAVGLVARDRAFDELRLKRPWLAGTLSAVLPGAGQLYNGRPLDALLAFLVNGAFAAGAVVAFTEADSVPLGVALALLGTGFWGGNVVNAVVDARRINAQRYLAFFDGLARDFWPRVAFVIDENEVSFTYGFDWPGPSAGTPAAGAPSAEKE